MKTVGNARLKHMFHHVSRPWSPPLILPGLVYWSIGAVFEAIRQGHVVSLLQDLNLYKVYCRETHAQKIVNLFFSDSTVWVDFLVNIMFIWYHPAQTYRWCCAVLCVVSPYSVSILKWKFHGGPTMLTQGATWLRRKLGVILAVWSKVWPILGGSSHDLDMWFITMVIASHCKSPNWGSGTPSKWPFHGLYIGVTNYLLTGMILPVMAIPIPVNLSGEDHYHNNTYLSCWLLIMMNHESQTVICMCFFRKHHVSNEKTLVV